MERVNEEIRDREKVMRGLERMDSSILAGYQICHNYNKPHKALDYRTPAEAAGIKAQGKDKWANNNQESKSSLQKQLALDDLPGIEAVKGKLSQAAKL